MLEWLLGAAVGPAAFALPVNWAADVLAGAAQRWFRRLRRTDDLSRLVRAATGISVDLARAEFDAVRKLLQDQQTWLLLGQGTVEDLATRIAACLPLRDGRTAKDSHAAALTIARGLFEFAVRDLEPKFFQQVLLARLRRMETDQASALDEAMFGLHADLITGFANVMAELDRVLDRLPPGPAHRVEIAVYLTTLIDWLSTDPWPRDRQFEPQDRQLEQPALTLAAMERKLRVTVTGRAGELDLDADELARQCRRLVILGGPGSGKTWLAKRTTRRCAEDALEALRAGAALDEVELPLYTTCSRLFSAAGDIRQAAVSSALDQLPDLGGSRISAALHVFFTERNAPTLLVIDSLDEAHGSGDRLRQADTLPWPIVLTSRPSSWNHQLAINDTDDSHRVGELQPLRYPDDVEAFIHRWFHERPDWGNDLAAQIAQRPGLQQAATVPLILAFYCIVGGGKPLPEFRRDLYASVLKRMLTGRWRDSADRRPDTVTCLRTLRGWAWSGATSHPVSGVGTWADDIPIERGPLGEADEDALDHVATPLGPTDVDTAKTLRRFVHRSIREHLVAEHLASLGVDQAAEALLPHLWYDPDWEHTAPAALAMHPEHDQLLRDLICRAASSDLIPGDLSVIDAGWEFRGLLARVASESREADWSPEVAGMIGHARVELARAGRPGNLGGAASWSTSNRQARDALLGLLASQTNTWEAADLVRGVVQLAPATEDKRQARDALLGLLAGQTDGEVAAGLVYGLVQLAPAAEDMRQAREVLLGLLRQTNGWAAARLLGGLVQLDPAAEDMRQAREVLLGLLASQTNGRVAARLVGGLVQLDPAAEDMRQARDVLLGLLAGQNETWEAAALVRGLVQLAPAAEDKRQARDALLGLLRQIDGWAAARLVGGLVQLDPAAEDMRQARDVLLGLLAGQTNTWEAAALVRGLVQLDPAAEDKRQARDALLGLLASQADTWEAAADLAGWVVQLDPTEQDNRRARDALLGLLAGQTDTWEIAALALWVVMLAPAEQDKRQARDALLGLLAGQTDGRVAEGLVHGLVQLDPTAEDKRQAREVLLGLLPGQTDGRVAEGLAGGVFQLDPTEQDKRQARDALLGLLASQTNSLVAADLAGRLVQLDPTEQDKRQARDALLGLLASQTNSLAAADLAGRLVQLDPTEQDKRQARDALLGLLASQTDDWVAAGLMRGVVQLAPTEQDKREAREVLLGLLPGQTNSEVAARLVRGVVQLDPTEQDKRQARDALLGPLAGQTDDRVAHELVAGVGLLAPTVRDLSTWRAWAVPPSTELLAAARRNSALTAWLSALADLAPWTTP